MEKQLTEEDVRRMINEMISNFDYKTFIKRGFIEVVDKATGKKVRLNGAKNRLEFLTNDTPSAYIQDDSIPNAGFTGTVFTILGEKAGLSLSAQEVSEESTLFTENGNNYFAFQRDSSGVDSAITNVDIIIEFPNWSTSTDYLSGQKITNSGQPYICLENHTSGTFATDLAASKWSTIDNIGLVLKSPDGTRYRIKVANDGTLSTEAY